MFWENEIDHLTLSHYHIIDNLREELMSLSIETLERTDLAVVVPAFELKGKDSCTSMKSCADR